MECESPWNASPPSIDLHGVSVMLSVACRDDSQYLTTQSYARWTYIPGTIIATTVYSLQVGALLTHRDVDKHLG